MTRYSTTVLLSLLSAGVLTFCAPHPARAQPANTALSTDNPTQYVRDLHKACLLETA